ncbi:hypothetical protein MEQU1_001146 [Malassezia equina]|uniref:HMG box domain-containing protein n=1 Tax=Malassezia equina TaxID=1381935 RepID=A0AAF0EC77_9BASI|nr:hypothetical protein MEQU1_001146 [Malassezia equina]
MGLLFILLCLILLSGRQASEGSHLTQDGSLEVRRNPQESTLETFFTQMQRQGYLEKVRVLSDGSSPSHEWRWGARAEVEIGEKAIASFIVDLYGDGAKSETEGVTRSTRSTGVTFIVGNLPSLLSWSTWEYTLSDQDAQLRSQLKPPKQYPSAWQMYFNEELQRIKAETPTARLNVAVLAKEAGQRYAKMSDEKKKEYIQRSNDAKEKYERDLAIWQSTLTPEDIRQENLFRSAQRRLGKSRRGNMRDPNAPKKPLTAYFLYLKSLRADTVSLKEILQGEHETTKQSVLAAARWRTLSDKEKQPFIDQAKQQKLEYERRRREYEQGMRQSDFIPRTDLLTFMTGDSTPE